jgi:nucleotide-binding universal stress UspA family protein
MKRVLLATDGSSCAEEAGWFLSHLPHAEKLDLSVLTVLQIPAVDRRAAPTAVTELVDHQRSLANKAFERIATMFEGANVRLEHVVREGHRGQVIVDLARQLHADLVVLGARGHSAVRRLLLGSTSDFVATQAPCSVLVVRPTGLRDQKRPIRIVLGYVESGPCEAALNEFCETTWGHQSDVHVVSVVSYVSAFLNEIVVDSAEARNEAERAVQRVAKQLRDTAPSTLAHLIESDHIGEGLVSFIEKNHCDLIVVGDTPHTALGRVLLGSVSRFVLRHAPCSVWITRNPVRPGQQPRRWHTDSEVARSNP